MFPIFSDLCESRVLKTVFPNRSNWLGLRPEHKRSGDQSSETLFSQINDGKVYHSGSQTGFVFEVKLLVPGLPVISFDIIDTHPTCNVTTLLGQVSIHGILF